MMAIMKRTEHNKPSIDRALTTEYTPLRSRKRRPGLRKALGKRIQIIHGFKKAISG